MIHLLLLTRALDHPREIDNGEREGEIDTSEHCNLVLVFHIPLSWIYMRREENLLMAKKIYHPHKHVTNANAPAASWHFAAVAAFPSARLRKVPARRPKAGIRVKKMRKKTRLVRMEQTR
jgi:hypothetical protein